MAVAALDTYMHRLIVERVFTHDELPPPLARLDVPFRRLLEQADETRAADRRKPNNSRPRVGVKRLLRDRLLRETFQNYDSVSVALAMAGRKRGWTDIGGLMTPPMAPPAIKERLNAIIMRRNQIVHEGDYARLEKPRTARRNGLTHAEIVSDIEFIGALIDAIHRVV